MPRVMILGRHAQILPFRAVGVEICDAENAEQAGKTLRGLHDAAEPALVLIPEDLAEECRNEIALLRQGVSAVVLSIPASRGEVGKQREFVRQLVAKSIGVDLMGRQGK